jgi:hypothetical protein
MPRLMTDEELAVVFEAFVKEVRGRPPKVPPKVPPEPPEPPKLTGEAPNPSVT